MNKTGKSGDGKIFVTPIHEAIRVRTGESGDEVLDEIEADSDSRVSDIHIWPLGAYSFAVIISIVTHFPKPPEYYKGLLGDFEELKHVTVEVNKVGGDPCLIQTESGS